MTNTKILTKEDTNGILIMLDILKKYLNAPKESLPFNILNALQDFLKIEERKNKAQEKLKRVVAGRKWKWTEERRKEHSKKMKKIMRRFWENKKKKAKEDGRKSTWTEERRKKQSKKIKKIWEERKTHHHKRKRKIWTAQEDGFIRRELKAGTTQKKIAERLNVGIPILKHRIRKLRGKE